VPPVPLRLTIGVLAPRVASHAGDLRTPVVLVQVRLTLPKIPDKLLGSLGIVRLGAGRSAEVRPAAHLAEAPEEA
jgi:hypothetical protein